MKISWQDIEEIGFSLSKKFPEIKPLEIRFTELLNLILQLEDFVGKREECNEAKLEAVQMAWYEEWKENQE